MNRNSQTTSTKCQYQAAAFEAEMALGVKWPAPAREQQTIRKHGADEHVKAVEAGSRKKVEGYTPPPTNLKGASASSIAWHSVKLRPSRMVRAKRGDQRLLVALQQGVMCPGDRGARQQQDHGVQRPGIWNGSKVWMVEGGQRVSPLP